MKKQTNGMNSGLHLDVHVTGRDSLGLFKRKGKFNVQINKLGSYKLRLEPSRSRDFELFSCLLAHLAHLVYFRLQYNFRAT